jgi:AAA family ATPase
MGELKFVVRPLTATGLDGAFRVHIAPEALDKIGLKVGDICQITDEDGSSGFGIAWRAADRMGTSPKVPPAKMSDALRETFGFKQGTQITISKCDKKITRAQTVSLTDVTPSDYDGTDDGNWVGRSRSLLSKFCLVYICSFLRYISRLAMPSLSYKLTVILVNCDAFSVGTTFDVAAKKGLKKRFFVEHIEAPGSMDSATLFVLNDATELKIVETVDESSESIQHKVSDMRLKVDRIGGLADQISVLNDSLRLLCKKAKQHNNEDDGFPWNSSILVHGYEGTGKTMLLEELERRSGARKAVRLEKRQLLGTASKNDAVIQAVFKDALANQPSLIVIDNLEKIATAGDTVAQTTVDSLRAGFDALIGTAVLVVAATRNHTDIDSSLMGPKRFAKTLELPVPDRTARVQIIRALLHKMTISDESLYDDIGSRTHGFTGKDLGLLVDNALDRSLLRTDREEEWVKVHSRSSTDESTEETLVDGASHGQPEPSGLPTHEYITPVVSLEDFEMALTQVRPTALREIILETPKVTWDDIGGSDAVKEFFDRTIGWPIKYPELCARFRRSNKQKGVLLYGPPGCSKTMTAQAVANTYGLNFIAVKGAELISMYVGESERAVREIFRKARAAAPSIIFFDEIDAIGSTRESGSSSGLHVLTTLLNEMDGFETLKSVQVLAATNQPESLDPAIMRPGRFDAHVYLGPPDSPARLEIMKIATKGLTLQSDVRLEELEKETEGHSGAEIVSACDLAADEALQRTVAGATDESLCKADFEVAFACTTKGITAEMLEAYDAFAQKGARR